MWFITWRGVTSQEIKPHCTVLHPHKNATERAFPSFSSKVASDESFPVVGFSGYKWVKEEEKKKTGQDKAAFISFMVANKLARVVVLVSGSGLVAFIKKRPHALRITVPTILGERKMGTLCSCARRTLWGVL